MLRYSHMKCIIKDKDNKCFTRMNTKTTKFLFEDERSYSIVSRLGSNVVPPPCGAAWDH
uniref:Uncharacterized protein n=1 Tax=Amphimedon queenslandica TaxID=400682 RepID=A0A1X7TSM9_AMPQE